MTMLHRFGLHVGRRGAFLALFGAVYLLIAYSFVGTRVTPQVRHSLRLALNVAPLDVYAWAWAAAGALAVLCGLFCPGRKALGFTAAVVMPTLWAVVYFAAWIAGDIPRGWVSGVLFVLIGAAVAVVAGMPEPRELLRGQV